MTEIRSETQLIQFYAELAIIVFLFYVPFVYFLHRKKTSRRILVLGVSFGLFFGVVGFTKVYNNAIWLSGTRLIGAVLAFCAIFMVTSMVSILTNIMGIAYLKLLYSRRYTTSRRKRM
jgi:hypothetical protein